MPARSNDGPLPEAMALPGYKLHHALPLRRGMLYRARSPRAKARPMLVLLLGLVLFLGVHSATILGVKPGLVGKYGAQSYKLGYAAVSLTGLVLVIYGFGLYRRTAWTQLWTPPRGMNHLAILLMLFAMIALASAWFPGEIKRRLKHPMLVAVKIWALAHLLANGDLGGTILFGSLLAWAVILRIVLKRTQPAAGLDIAPGWAMNDWLAAGIGVAVWAVFGFVLHPWLIGVPVLG